MKQRVVLINPPLVSQPSDCSGTGTPYWPITLASINAMISRKYDVAVFDLYGQEPDNIKRYGDNYRHGWEIDTLYYAGGEETVAVVYDNFAIAHETVIEMIRILKEDDTKRIIVVENSQHVTAFPLDKVKDELFEAGADCIVCGDPEGVIIDAIEGKLPKFGRYFLDSTRIPIPKWDGFPIEHYWDLEYAHAPKTNEKYIPLLTSRGCPGECRFCTNPFLNKSRWRARSPLSVFTEINSWYKKGVREFHIEDLNPTVSKARIIDLCDMIVDNRLKIDIKIASGTKMETLDAEVLSKMHEAGFSYLSFSPESGSAGLLEHMGKSFDHAHALKMLGFIKKNYGGSMITQACFILGYPGERGCDVDLTNRVMNKMAKAGLDEVAIFNWVPMPGSVIADSVPVEVPFGKLSFSSDWRTKNKFLRSLRNQMVFEFYKTKLFSRGFGWIFDFKKTKTYMTIKRLVLTKFRLFWGSKYRVKVKKL